MLARSILITGGTGFLGEPLVRHLASQDKYSVRAAVRNPVSVLPSVVQVWPMGSFDGSTTWGSALAGVDALTHAAARVHVLRERSVDPKAEFQINNVDSTLNLARQAAAAGVRRFAFIRAIKVSGEFTQTCAPFRADDIPNPTDSYDISKWKAEQGLMALAELTGMEVVIIRPPLVYGPGVRANFLTMMQRLKKGIPLPFGSINNRRSLVGLDNLINLIECCLDHPGAANQTFLAADGEDVSSTELLRRLALALQKASRLVRFPVGLLETVAKLLGMGAVSERLFASLQVDISKNNELLGWKPPITLDEGLKRTADYFAESRRHD